MSSAVTPMAAVSSHPDYSSATAFKAWLESYNASIGTNSGNAHNLAALAPEIATSGYADILIDHLNSEQKKLFDLQMSYGETPSGIWQTELNYRAVWGAFKYMYIYNLYDEPISLEYAPYMIQSCLAVVRLDPGVGSPQYNDIMNQWSSITNILSNVSEHYGDEEAQKLYDMVREDAVFLVENTIEKIAPFRMDDGSFAVNPDGTTPSTIYGVNIAVGGLREGTVNSTNIIVNIYSLVCEALGCPTFSLCTLEEGYALVETLKSLEPLDKITISTEKYDFEDADIPLTVTIAKNNSSASLEIVDDPDEGDGALYFYSPSGDVVGDVVQFTTSGIGSSCYIFDSDMYISSESTKDMTLLRLRIGGGSPIYMLEMIVSGSSVKIREVSSIDGHNVNDLTTVSVDEWFNLRVECYAPGESNDLPVMRVYVNEELIKESSNFFGSHNESATPSTTFSSTHMLSLRRADSKVYFDNTLSIKSGDVYTQ